MGRYVLAYFLHLAMVSHFDSSFRSRNLHAPGRNCSEYMSNTDAISLNTPKSAFSMKYLQHRHEKLIVQESDLGPPTLSSDDICDGDKIFQLRRLDKLVTGKIYRSREREVVATRKADGFVA